MYPPEPDDHILDLLLRDDQRGMSMLYTRYYPRLYLMLRKFLIPDYDVRDILQQLLSHIWENRHSLRLRNPLLPYLYQAARNRALNYLRKRGKRPEIILSPYHLADASMLVSEPADSYLLAEEVQRLWLAAEQKLTGRMREAFVLRHHDQKSVKEVAAVMGVSVSATEKILRRAEKIVSAIRRQYLSMLIMLPLAETL